MKRRLLLLLVAWATITSPFVVVASSYAAPLVSGCTGSLKDSSTCKDANISQAKAKTDNKLYGPNGVLTKGAAIIAYIGGIAAIIMIILGAFTFMTSGSEPAKVAVARKTILYAMVGLVILVIPSAIIRFVVSRL